MTEKIEEDKNDVSDLNFDEVQDGLMTEKSNLCEDSVNDLNILNVEIPIKSKEEAEISK